jgi:hypothetical protein
VAKLNNSRIPESLFEHRQSFSRAWVNEWVLPNPFISPIHDALSTYGVTLSDFSFAREASNVGETALSVLIRNLNASVKVGLDSLVFSSMNPDWSEASRLSTVFEKVAQIVRDVVHSAPSRQDAILALHLIDESKDLKAASAKLVNTSLVGEAAFYGISIHRNTGPLLIEKSLKYENAIFLRIQHQFPGDESFASIAATMYEEEVFSLGLLGLIDPDQVKLW